MQISQFNKQALRNPWVIGWLIAVFMVFVINVAFISTAIFTNPGLVEENYYEKGQDHERNVQTKLATRTRLGWQMAIEAATPIIQGQNTNIYFDLKDRDGIQLNVEQVALTAYRPSDADADMHVVMENSGPGRYLATLNFPLKGVWKLQAIAHQGELSIESSTRIQVATGTN